MLQKRSDQLQLFDHKLMKISIKLQHKLSGYEINKHECIQRRYEKRENLFTARKKRQKKLKKKKQRLKKVYSQMVDGLPRKNKKQKSERRTIFDRFEFHSANNIRLSFSINVFLTKES